MTFPYSQQNTLSRRRLESFAQGLSDEDLACSNEHGWTVAALLAHLAFWDHRMSEILRRWQADGLDESPIDSTAVNDALRVIFLELEPRTAARLAISAAQKIDAELETLTPELVRRYEEHAAATFTQFRMNRSFHRDGHLNEIEALLQRGE